MAITGKNPYQMVLEHFEEIATKRKLRQLDLAWKPQDWGLTSLMDRANEIRLDSLGSLTEGPSLKEKVAKAEAELAHKEAQLQIISATTRVDDAERRRQLAEFLSDIQRGLRDIFNDLHDGVEPILLSVPLATIIDEVEAKQMELTQSIKEV